MPRQLLQPLLLYHPLALLYPRLLASSQSNSIAPTFCSENLCSSLFCAVIAWTSLLMGPALPHQKKSLALMAKPSRIQHFQNGSNMIRHSYLGSMPSSPIPLFRILSVWTPPKTHRLCWRIAMALSPAPTSWSLRSVYNMSRKGRPLCKTIFIRSRSLLIN